MINIELENIELEEDWNEIEGFLDKVNGEIYEK